VSETQKTTLNVIYAKCSAMKEIKYKVKNVAVPFELVWTVEAGTDSLVVSDNFNINDLTIQVKSESRGLPGWLSWDSKIRQFKLSTNTAEDVGNYSFNIVLTAEKLH
jgi:hypothetical protein